MDSIPAFVISLPEAAQRRETMKGRLGKIGIDFTFFDAVDGRAFDVPKHPDYDGFRRRAFFGKDLTGGEMGCLLSHRAIYEKMVTEGIKTALVFEDDAIVHDDLPRVVAALRRTKHPYDLVRFLGSEKVARLTQKVVVPLTGVYTLNRLSSTPGGAHAYLVTLDGARKMLEAMRRNWLPVDTLMGHVWATGVRGYIVQPGVAVHDLAEVSFIGDARFEKNQAGARPWYFPLSRLIFKVYEGVMKRLSYWAG